MATHVEGNAVGLNILLDGGLGQELVHRAGRVTPMLALQALVDDRNLIRAVHDDSAHTVRAPSPALGCGFASRMPDRCH